MSKPNLNAQVWTEGNRCKLSIRASGKEDAEIIWNIDGSSHSFCVVPVEDLELLRGMILHYLTLREGRPSRPTLELFKEGCKPREKYP